MAGVVDQIKWAVSSRVVQLWKKGQRIKRTVEKTGTKIYGSNACIVTQYFQYVILESFVGKRQRKIAISWWALTERLVDAIDDRARLRCPDLPNAVCVG